MRYFATREIRLLRGLVDEGTIITVPADLDQDHANRLLALEYIEAAPAADEIPEAVEIASLTVPQLKEMAAAEGIDLGEAKTKAEIIKVIEAATAAA